MVVERQYINADRFVELVQEPQYDDCIVELVEGEIVDMPLPSGQHGQITMLLSVKIANFVISNSLGVVTSADTGFVLERNPDGRDTIRGLDIAFIRSAKIPSALPDELIEVAPDLAVEVISPSNEAKDIRLKIRQLLDSGTSLIWIVYPDLRIVDVHTPEGATTLEENDTLAGGEVLPGFEVHVADIFPS